MKQTIALIGKSYQSEEALLRLASRYRLLLVAQGEVPPLPAISNLPGAEVEVVHCAREGSWEADMIMLSGAEIQQELLEKIREVATKKIVMVIRPAEIDAPDEALYLSLLRECLPFSKLVEVSLGPGDAVAVGNDPAAVSTADEIVKLLG